MAITKLKNGVYSLDGRAFYLTNSLITVNAIPQIVWWSSDKKEIQVFTQDFSIGVL